MVDLRSELDQRHRNNRLHLRNFLLNGDTRESDASGFEGQGDVDHLIVELKKQHRTLRENRERANQLLDRRCATWKETGHRLRDPLWWTSGARWIPAALPWPNYQIAYLQANPRLGTEKREESRCSSWPPS